MCSFLNTGAEPDSDPVSYAGIGNDLDGIPIEAGFGETEWRFAVLPQSDYEFLLAQQGDVAGTAMTVRTQKRSGASGIDFGNYQAVVGRPTFGRREGLVVYDIRMPITRMVEI